MRQNVTVRQMNESPSSEIYVTWGTCLVKQNCSGVLTSIERTHIHIYLPKGHPDMILDKEKS